MTNMGARALFLLAILALQSLIVPPALAQRGVSVLKGRVVDRNTGDPVARARVTVTSPALQGEASMVTDAKGRYRIPQLPHGQYTVRVASGAFQPYERANIEVRSDTQVQIDVQLSGVDAQIEEIEIVSSGATVDVGSAQTATAVTSEMLQHVPLAAPTASPIRSMESVATVAPQAKSDALGASIAGTTSPENNYSVDGISVGNPAVRTLGTPLSMEFVGELNVVTSGYLPEYGKATGGVLSAVTKTGSNEFKGNVWSYLSPGGLEGRRKLVTRTDSTIFTQSKLAHIYDFGLDFSGPIIEDTLWFYTGAIFASKKYNMMRGLYARPIDPTTGEPVLDAAGNEIRDLIPGTSQRMIAAENNLQAIGKLTYSPNRNNRMSLTVIANPTWAGGGDSVGPNVVSTAGEPTTYRRQSRNNVMDILGKWNLSSSDYSVLLDTTFGVHIEAQDRFAADGSGPGQQGHAQLPLVGWQRTHPGYSITNFEGFNFPGLLDNACRRFQIPNPDPPQPGMPPQPFKNAADPCPSAFYRTGGPGYLQDVDLRRYQLTSIGTINLTDLAGSHEIKAGVDIDLTTYRRARAYSGDRIVYESTGGTYFYDRRSFGFLQAPDLATLVPVVDNSTRNVNLGAFVQDAWTVTDDLTLNAGLRYDAQMLYGGNGRLGITLPFMLGPRVGVIWDPTQAGNARVFANYARFYHSIPLRLADRAASGEPSIHGYYQPTPAYQSVREWDKQWAHNPNGAPLRPAECDRSQTSGPTACFDTNVPYARVPNGRNDPNQSYRHSAGLVPVDPDLEPQYASELSAGAEYNIQGVARVGVSLTRRWLGQVIEDMSRDEGQTYFVGNPGSGITPDFPKARRVYDAFALYATKPLNRNWILETSYTLSYVRGNMSGLFRPETGQLDPNLNADFDLDTLLVNRDGPLPADQRHQFKLFGAYIFDIGHAHHVNLGLALHARSGAPSNYLGAHEIYGNDELFILPRGSGPRKPWFFDSDVNLSYSFDLDDRRSIALSLDVFNILNLQRAVDLDERYTRTEVRPLVGGTPAQLSTLQNADGTPFDHATDRNPNFQQPSAYQRPRYVRFGLRGRF